MRDIKFKARRLDNGEWLEGQLVADGEKHYWIVYDFDFYETNQIMAKALASDRYAEVQPETICQYTGLKDSNGKEIWEGDIVDGFAGEHYQGIWEYQNRFAIEFGWTQSMWDMLNFDRLEVIGNIYDKEGV